MDHTPASGAARWATWLATLAAIVCYGAIALLAASQLTACGGGEDPAHSSTQQPACQANRGSCT